MEGQKRQEETGRMDTSRTRRAKEEVGKEVNRRRERGKLGKEIREERRETTNKKNMKKER